MSAVRDFVTKQPCAFKVDCTQLEHLPDLRHQKIKLVISSMWQWTIQDIVGLYDGVAGAKKIIPVITDADKQGSVYCGDCTLGGANKLQQITNGKTNLNTQSKVENG